MENTKSCSKCDEIRPFEDFYKDKRLKSGLQSQCKACSLEVKKKKYQENPELKKAKSQKYRDEHPDYYVEHREACLARQSKYRSTHPDKTKADNEKFKRDNPEYFKEYRDTHKEETAARVRKWAQDNSGARTASAAKQRAARLLRTPPWSETEAIVEFYKNCPPRMVGDHIIPLQGKTVSGLHVIDNLQYLTPKENGEKSNYFNPEDHFWTIKDDKHRDKLEGHYGTEEETHIQHCTQF